MRRSYRCPHDVVKSVIARGPDDANAQMNCRACGFWSQCGGPSAVREAPVDDVLCRIADMKGGRGYKNGVIDIVKAKFGGAVKAARIRGVSWAELSKVLIECGYPVSGETLSKHFSKAMFKEAMSDESLDRAAQGAEAEVRVEDDLPADRKKSGGKAGVRGRKRKEDAAGV